MHGLLSCTAWDASKTETGFGTTASGEEALFASPFCVFLFLSRAWGTLMETVTGTLTATAAVYQR